MIVLPLKIPSKRINDSIEYNNNLKRLSNILLGFSEGYFKDLRLSNAIKEDLRSFKSDLRDAERAEIISNMEKNEGVKLLEKAENEKNLAESEVRKLEDIYGKITTYLDESTTGYNQRVSNYESNKQDEISDIFLEEVNDLQERSTKQKLEDFIVEADKGHYMSELAQILHSRWGKGFSPSNVQQLVERMEGKTIETEGGWGTGRKRRICYPKITEEEIRQIRKGKEQRFRGQITENISNHFILESGVPSLQVHRFRSDSSGELYVLAKENLPMEKDITSIGLFKKGNLQKVMQQKGYKLNPQYDNSDAINQDSQVAYIISKGGQEIYRDKNSKRARELSPEVDSSPNRMS